MSENMFFWVAVFVFVMMAIGLGLTIWEFRYGQPRREDELGRKAQASSVRHDPRVGASRADSTA